MICWQFLAFEHNLHEVPKAIDKARELGVDEFKLARPFDISWDDPAMRPANIQPELFLFNLESESRMCHNWNPFPDDLDTESIVAGFEEDFSCPPEVEPTKRAEHTCRWLYKNIAMDANGRIFPCSGAPGPNSDLVYASLNSSDPFNSDRYRMARLFFADRQAYDRENHMDPEPYCSQCEFSDCTADIDSTQIRQYLRAAGAGLFNPRCADILSSW
ncbi:MAG: hypothetical protein M3Y27_20625 [Acidobacteriota bacterium]|nr:hypothetical protein [Acidobacteriota bacterium]